MTKPMVVVAVVVRNEAFNILGETISGAREIVKAQYLDKIDGSYV